MTGWADNPQAAQIDALIERAGQLVEAEAEALGAAWDAALDAAWDAARSAALGAARSAALGAARSAAWMQAAACAVALVARDLLDETTSWNRAAYDVLTGPWRSAIGPIHPDDPDDESQTAVQANEPQTAIDSAPHVAFDLDQYRWLGECSLEECPQDRAGRLGHRPNCRTAEVRDLITEIDRLNALGLQ